MHENATEFERFLSVAAVAAVLGISHQGVRNAVRRGDLRGVRVGDLIRIPAAELEQFLVKQGLDPGALYRGPGSPVTARPAPGTANADRPISAGAVVR